MSLTTASTSNFRLILDALDDYTKQTGIDLSKNPFAESLQNCDSPDSVLQLLQDRAVAFKDYRDGNRNLINWLSPVVQVLHTFSSILGEVAGLVLFQPARLIFVGIDALLKAASGITASYDALVDLFKCIGNFLNRLRVYTEIPFTPTMTDIIVKILVEVLGVFALATKQIKQGRFKKFAKKLLGESEIEAVLQRLDRLTQDEARMTVAQTLEVVYGLVSNMKEVMDEGRASTDQMRQALVAMQETTSEINKMKRDHLQERIKNWLSPPDSSKNHNIARAAHYSRTSTWFTKGSTFEEWKANGSLLYIHGKPGSGKSILCSTVIEEVKERREAGLALMGYVYFDFRDTAKQDVRGLLSSLLAQFCAKSDRCHDILSELYSTHDAGSQQPSDNALMECLKKILKLPGQPAVYIIVDALDECPNTSGFPTAREKVLELLEDLVTLKLPNLRICVTSRPETDIRTILEPLASFHVSLHDQTGQKNDIRDYVSKVVHSDPRMRRWRAEDKQLVIDTLSAKADGMFRWVFCQLDTLRRCPPPAIRRALVELPKSLDETYERTLLGIEEEQRDYAHRLFQFLTVAVRPLRVEELADVLAIRFESGQLPEYHVDWRSEDPQEAVLRACSALINVIDVDGSQVVQFSHFSVKEFLTSDRLAIAANNLSHYHVVPESAHAILAQASLSILLHLDNEVDRSAMENFPLALYAAQHWIDHGRFEDVSSQIQEQMSRLFDGSKPYFSTWVWLHDIDLPFREPMFSTQPALPEASPLYYATLCGFGGIVEHLVIADPGDVNKRGGFYCTPLHAALAKGYLNIASLLLEHGADANALDNEQSSPLRFASRAGRRDIAELLLEHYADVNIRNQYGETPLDLAARNGELEVAHVLLRHSSPVDSRDKDGQTPLQAASQNGHLAVVQLLLQSGAAIDSRDDEGWTPLQTASQYGHSDIVQELLDHGADPNAQKKDLSTALHQASGGGYLEVAQLLVRRDAAVDTKDHKGETPLHLASAIGNCEIARLLIERGADVYSRDNNGWTPCHKASWKGHLDVVRFLFEHITDVDIRTGGHMTPLVLASWNGNLDVSHFLIERGADVNSSDKQGRTSLHFASEHGHLDAVRVLLDNGAGVNAQKADLWTPLHLASANGHVSVAELLIQRGAGIDKHNRNVETPLDQGSGSGQLETARSLVEDGLDTNAQDSNGWTPLHTAAWNGQLDIVALLLESGADVKARNGSDETAFDLAYHNGELGVARFLAERMGFQLDPISEILLPDLLQSSLDHVEDTTSPDSEKTSLHTASEAGNLDVVQLLLDHGADVNERNAKHETPLDVAATEGKLEVSKLLIKHGADVNSRDKAGWTPLHDVSRYGHRDIARLLLEHGADVNAKKPDRWTPLHLASHHGYPEIVKLLLERGANIHVRNEERHTPYQLAIRRGHREITQLLSGYRGYGV